MPLLRIDDADEPVPQLIPQHFPTPTAPASATKPIDAARTGIPNAPTQPRQQTRMYTDYESVSGDRATRGNGLAERPKIVRAEPFSPLPVRSRYAYGTA
jgi:hypothetical protein